MSSIPPRRPGDHLQWDNLAAITWATQKKYCDIQGYDFHGDVSDVWESVRSPIRGDANVGYSASIRHFIKFRLFEHFLSQAHCGVRYDWCVWLDADCLVTNYEVPLQRFFNQGSADEPVEAMLGDVVIPHDINGLHPTVIMMRASPVTRDLAWAAAHMGQTMFQQHDWDDIMAFRFYMATQPYRDMLWDRHPARDLCALHPGFSNEYGHPIEGVGHYWTPHSLTLHLSAMDLASRVKVASEYCEKLELL